MFPVNISQEMKVEVQLFVDFKIDVQLNLNVLKIDGKFSLNFALPIKVNL